MSSAGLLRYLDAPARGGPDDGPRGTLVLLHAFPLNAHMWEPQLALASQGWRVIAPHFRGFDGSPPCLLPASMDDYANDVIDLLDALHVRRAVVAGLSMGGYLAFALWRLAPRYVSGLVLADTRPQADDAAGRQQRERMLGLVRDEGPAAVAREMVPRLLSDRAIREQPLVVERVRSWIMASSPSAIAAAIRVLMTRDDSTALLQSITAPTMVIVGEHDALTPPAISRTMQREIPGAELALIPEAGHLSSVEQPGCFNRVVASFLARRV
jgi:pimeloyl-ACP methyl ester carboxylesterase